MSSYDPRSWLQRLVGACLSLLFAAVALYTAVRLIRSVAVPLLVIGGVAALAGLAILLLRRRNRIW
jgi:LPXTG-motif cell wall-anchored protein